MYAVASNTFEPSSLQLKALIHIAKCNMAEQVPDIETLKNDLVVLGNHAGDSTLSISITEDGRGIQLTSRQGCYTDSDSVKIITIHPIC